jgi:hypothetical protein
MITQTACTVFKVNLLNGAENFTTGVYKMALYTALADLDANTLTYTTSNEISGTGYTAGGKTLTNIVPTSSNNVAYISFDPLTWNPASFTARGALIYNSATNAAVAVLDFGSDKTATNTFTVTFPAATSSSAVIRLA